MFCRSLLTSVMALQTRCIKKNAHSDIKQLISENAHEKCYFLTEMCRNLDIMQSAAFKIFSFLGRKFQTMILTPQ